MLNSQSEKAQLPQNLFINENPNDDVEDDELTIDDLQILINQLSFQDEAGNFPKRLISLQFLLEYIQNYKLPPPIMIQLHRFIFFIIQQQNPKEINEVILFIITNIYNTFNDTTDDNDSPVNFPALINFLWQMIPYEEAFESIALISSKYLEAAKIVVQQKEQIFIWLGDQNCIHNALIIVESLMCHEAIRSDLAPYINNFLDLSQGLSSFHMQTLYSILGYYCLTERGIDSIQNYPMIGTLFDKALENPDIFYEALCFTKIIVRKLKKPIIFMEKANILNFFEKSLNSPIARIQLEGLDLCNALADDIPILQFMFQNGIVDKLFTLTDSNIDISSAALETLCKIISEGPPDFIPQFVERGMIDIITMYFPIVNRRCKHQMLTCIQTIANYFQKTGDTKGMSSLATDDLADVLLDINNSEENSALWDIALWVYRQIFPDQS